MPNKKSDRCWPGYEPVPAKPEHSQGSCRPKPESKLTLTEKSFRARRKRRLDHWQGEHKESPRKSAQHLSAPGTSSKGKKRSTKHAA